MNVRVVSDRRIKQGMLVSIRKTRGSVQPVSYAAARPRTVMMPKTLIRRACRRLTGPVIGFACEDSRKGEPLTIVTQGAFIVREIE